ncbi:MAG: PEP-CTERM sorting domain-containing protein [Candidatus Limnocylindria bacterium]|jgi:hypothetical protein
MACSNDCNAFNGGTSSIDYGSAGFSSPGVIPEPSTFLLLGFGLAGLARVGRRHRKQSQPGPLSAW